MLRRQLNKTTRKTKQDNQITDETRTNLEVEKVNSTHKRKDYPQVPATATKEYICDLCGKSYQSRDDLIHHQEFESKGKSQ